MIVMATHGRTGLFRVLMGSVAEEVVRKAKCPVLAVVRARSRFGSIETLFSISVALIETELFRTLQGWLRTGD
jgi:hypothetical protein